MVRNMPMIHISQVGSFSPIPLAVGLFVSVSLLVALCAKHATKYTTKTSGPSSKQATKYATKTSEPSANKAPLPSPKQLIATISQKAMMPLVHGKKPAPGQEPGGCQHKGGQEENGLWQKAILMGERCQPLEFSGVIYYDYSGNRIPEMPRSPRAGSMSPLRNFRSLPLQKKESSVY